jgi:hypothetical protein
MLFDLTIPCYLTTFSGKKCLSGKVICAFLGPAYRNYPVDSMDKSIPSRPDLSLGPGRYMTYPFGPKTILESRLENILSAAVGKDFTFRRPRVDFHAKRRSSSFLFLFYSHTHWIDPVVPGSEYLFYVTAKLGWGCCLDDPSSTCMLQAKSSYGLQLDLGGRLSPSPILGLRYRITTLRE